MFTELIGKFGFLLGCLAASLLVVMMFGISWFITCGIVYLITLCFNLTFSWSIATGIWLVMCLLRSVFNVTVKK